MNRLHLTLAASALALTLGACAATTTDEPEAPVAFDTTRQCFFTSQINGFSNAPDGPNGEERLVVHTGPNDSWLFEAFGNSCNDLDFAQGVAFDPRTMTSMCTGTTETLLVPRPGGGPAERCSVRLLGKVIEQD